MMLLQYTIIQPLTMAISQLCYSFELSLVMRCLRSIWKQRQRMDCTSAIKTIQNEVITTSGDIIHNKILHNVRQASFFSVIANEATDVANVEQLSISVCFVDGETVCEKFLAFLKCEKRCHW